MATVRTKVAKAATKMDLIYHHFPWLDSEVLPRPVLNTPWRSVRLNRSSARNERATQRTAALPPNSAVESLTARRAPTLISACAVGLVVLKCIPCPVNRYLSLPGTPGDSVRKPQALVDGDSVVAAAHVVDVPVELLGGFEMRASPDLLVTSPCAGRRSMSRYLPEGVP